MPYSIPISLPTSAPALDPQEITTLLDQLKNAQMPTQEQVIQQLSNLSAVHGLVMLVAGAVCLLTGWKIFRAMVVINAAALGAGGGWWAGHLVTQVPNLPLYAAIGGGLLLAILAWPLMRWAIALMGVLAGAALGFWLTRYASQAMNRADLLQYAWVGAVAGMIVLGLLSFVIFRLAIQLITSLQGSVLVVAGLIVLAMKSDQIGPSLHKQLNQNVHLLPALIVVPALLGFIFQYRSAARAAKKTAEA